MSTPEDILPTYERLGRIWAETRSRSLYEKRWLDRFLAFTPLRQGGRKVLDLGCGAGRPIGEYLVDRGCALTGVDGSLAMITLFSKVLPRADAIHSDMRGLDLETRFDGVIAWDSFFHLSPEDQAPMFDTFRRHLVDGGALMFTSGPDDGVAIGDIEGAPIYHASLDPDRYRALLDAAGFDVIDFVPEDPDCGGHSVWLARARPSV